MRCLYDLGAVRARGDDVVPYIQTVASRSERLPLQCVLTQGGEGNGREVVTAKTSERSRKPSYSGHVRGGDVVPCIRGQGGEDGGATPQALASGRGQRDAKQLQSKAMRCSWRMSTCKQVYSDTSLPNCAHSSTSAVPHLKAQDASIRGMTVPKADSEGIELPL